MKDDIYAGLKSAIERGENLDMAIKSFINAGYNPMEVKEAAKMISEGATTIMEGNNVEKKPALKKGLPPMPATPRKSEVRQVLAVQKPRGSGKKIAMIIILIVILLALIGVAVFLFLNLPD